MKVWNILNVKDCARIDYCLRDGDVYFTEINTLPGLNPDPNIVSYFPLAARKAGLDTNQMIDRIVRSAQERYK